MSLVALVNCRSCKGYECHLTILSEDSERSDQVYSRSAEWDQYHAVVSVSEERIVVNINIAFCTGSPNIKWSTSEFKSRYYLGMASFKCL